jgi:hypothetical protein
MATTGTMLRAPYGVLKPVPYVQLGGLDGQVMEVEVPVDLLPLAQLVALLADGQEIIGEQWSRRSASPRRSGG